MNLRLSVVRSDRLGAYREGRMPRATLGTGLAEFLRRLVPRKRRPTTAHKLMALHIHQATGGK